MVLNHAIAYAWNHKNSPPIIRFARAMVIISVQFRYELRVAIGERRKGVDETEREHAYHNVNTNGATISIDEYDKWK